MKTEVLVSPQVRAFHRSLAPEPRSRFKSALTGLAEGRGDIRALEGRLAGLYRLRVGRYRIIYRNVDGRIRCFFAEERSIVYDALSANLGSLLRDER